MARKKKSDQLTFDDLPPAEPTNQPITETIEKNYMPYVMSVIVSRAIPEIDGFKPSHRKLLYTMYKMGLLTGGRTKSANIVGQTMRLNPHGDAAIYETMVRLTRGNEALLHPFVDSKGSFGKQYSRDMAYAASRYTEAKLDPICAEIFGGIDRDAVDLVPNYDNTTTEPTLLPTSFPNILVSSNMGIAVGLQSQICSFNLGEVCDGTIAVLRDPAMSAEELMDIIKAPDFPGGGGLIYNREQMREIFETGRGKLTLRSRYVYDKNSGCIEIVEIPYSTSIELIFKKLTDMIKDGQLKEVTDVRDEIDLHGFKLTLDVRRGTDPDMLMAKLFKKTPLQDDFTCNFNVLIDGEPRLLGVRAIIEEWIKFRMKCVSRTLSFDLDRKCEKLHLLLGLGEILLDIDKAIKIVRETEKDADVVPNLMEGFGIDRVQAEYIAEIKLRHLNREYIVERIKEIELLQREIADLRETLGSEKKLKKLIATQLEEVKKKYAVPRKTRLITDDTVVEYKEEDFVDNYNVKFYFTKGGYFKKITLTSLRGADEQKLKEGDEIAQVTDGENISELIFVSDKQRIYRAKASDFDTCKASALGDYIPAKLGFDKDEKAIAMDVGTKYDDKHFIVYIFENGKGVKIPLSLYETKAARKKLVAAYSAASPIVAAFFISENEDIILVNSQNKAIVINTKLIPEKATRTAGGVTLFTLKAGQTITEASRNPEKYEGANRCRKIKIPATGTALGTADKL